MDILPSQLASPLVVRQPVSESGKRAIPLSLDFGSQSQFSLNLQQSGALTNFGMVQGLYFDATKLSVPGISLITITVLFPITGQSVELISGTSGYLEVLCPNPTYITFSASAFGGVLRLELLNYPPVNVIW